MQSKVVRTLALVFLLGAAAVGLAQQQTKQTRVEEEEQAGQRGKQQAKKARIEEEEEASRGKQKPSQAKSKLEEMLTEALKNNPDIRVAAAKLAEADAELNRTRLQVMQKVVTVYYAIETQKKTVEHQESRYKRLAELNKNGAAVGPEDIAEAKQALALTKAKLEELEAQLPALLGTMTQAEALYNRTIQQAKLLRQEAVRSSVQTRRATIEEAELERTYSAPGPMGERIRKALSRPMTVQFADTSVEQVANTLSDNSGLVIKYVRDRTSPVEETVTLLCKELPLASVLQLLGDSLPAYSIVVRDYGLLIAPSKDIPQEAISIQRFLREKQAEQERRESGPESSSNAGQPWHPPEGIEGQVVQITPTGSVILDLNSSDGLLIGHTLYLYRPGNEPSKTKYLGTVRIVGAASLGAEHRSMGMAAHPVGRLSEAPKVGDKVSVRPPSGVKFSPKKQLNPFDAGKKAPAESVEGLVKTVDDKGLITISIGSDAGLTGGQTLELHWMPHKPPINDAHPFGTVRIVEVEAHQAVVQPVGRLAHNPQPGDRIIGSVQKK